jgi:hypothetical protein
MRGGFHSSVTTPGFCVCHPIHTVSAISFLSVSQMIPRPKKEMGSQLIPIS